MTQLALNAKISNITKITLFFANYNRELNLQEKTKASISLVSHRESSDIKKDTRQHLKDARKVYQVLKRKTKNNILAKEEK